MEKNNIKKKLEKFKNFVNQNNDDGVFDPLLNYMKEEQLKYGNEPSMQELFNFMKENNGKGIYNPLLKKINEKQFD